MTLFIDGAQVQKLRKAIDEYENDKWRLIAAKVGSGFSPTACQEKAEELEAQEELEEEMSTESRQESPSSAQLQTTTPSPQVPVSRPMQAASSTSSPPPTSARLM